MRDYRTAALSHSKGIEGCEISSMPAPGRLANVPIPYVSVEVEVAEHDGKIDFMRAGLDVRTLDEVRKALGFLKPLVESEGEG